jgi:hypothetical protein
MPRGGSERSLNALQILRVESLAPYPPSPRVLAFLCGGIPCCFRRSRWIGVGLANACKARCENQYLNGRISLFTKHRWLPYLKESQAKEECHG